MLDLYTKCVLTIIAAALSIIAAHNMTGGAIAQGDRCGTTMHQPCWVIAAIPLEVVVTSRR